MEAGQGLGVAVGFQTDGTLNLFLQQLQGLCESPAGEKNHKNIVSEASWSMIQYVQSFQEVGMAPLKSLELTSLVRELQPFHLMRQQLKVIYAQTEL